MNLSEIQYAINWWNKNGQINIPLLEKVLEAKKSFVPKNTFKKHLNIQSNESTNRR